MKRHLFAVVMLLAGPAFAQQRAPEIAFTSVPDYPNLPAGMNFGEVPGVAVNSSGHVFVFSRSNSANGPAFGAAAAQLFEFDQNGLFVREIGVGLYGFLFAHAARVDAQDNIWVVDEGANQVIKFSPDGKELMRLGKAGVSGNGPDVFSAPSDVVVGAATDDDRMLCFRPDNCSWSVFDVGAGKIELVELGRQASTEIR